MVTSNIIGPKGLWLFILARLDLLRAQTAGDDYLLSVLQGPCTGMRKKHEGNCLSFYFFLLGSGSWNYSQYFFVDLVCWDTVSLYNLCWPGTQLCRLGWLRTHRDPSASPLLKLKMGISCQASWNIFKSEGLWSWLLLNFSFHVLEVVAFEFAFTRAV